MYRSVNMWVRDFDKSTQSICRISQPKYYLSKVRHPCVVIARCGHPVSCVSGLPFQSEKKDIVTFFSPVDLSEDRVFLVSVHALVVCLLPRYLHWLHVCCLGTCIACMLVVLVQALVGCLLSQYPHGLREQRACS